ncbi:hypothetical protein LPB248_00270 [Flavobacterium sp. LPB0248]|uniref:hypothetical protein n=1 Tax=Flavobacterium sp. LPB0248 TaxID=2614441 RepID=UPI0015A6E04A|nr:hypothetical protein [Flavobacterium sp. LPB0248]QLC64769.1 hypothetical protein LPB248_00270 [Flavobacterium sp. LPB0248]
MKNIKYALFFIILMSVACKPRQALRNAKSQNDTAVCAGNSKFKNPYHKPLAEFKGDTLKYLQTNFLSDKEFYMGKELNVLLEDLELDIKDYSNGLSAKNINLSPDLSLNFYDAKAKNKKIKNKENPLILFVEWETPISASKVTALLKKNQGRWTADEKNYYGQFKIKEIGMVSSK